MQKVLLSARIFFGVMFGTLLLLLSSQPTNAGTGQSGFGIAPTGYFRLLH